MLRVHRAVPGEAPVTIDLDPLGRRQAMTDAAGKVIYTRDDAGRLAEVRRDGLPALRFGYDERGRPSRVVADASASSPASGALTFSYFESGALVGRLREARAPGGMRRSYRYDGVGRLASVDCGDAYRVEYSYDPRGLLTGLAYVAQPRPR